jgi:hypothetical protein
MALELAEPHVTVQAARVVVGEPGWSEPMETASVPGAHWVMSMEVDAATSKVTTTLLDAAPNAPPDHATRPAMSEHAQTRARSRGRRNLTRAVSAAHAGMLSARVG